MFMCVAPKWKDVGYPPRNLMYLRKSVVCGKRIKEKGPQKKLYPFLVSDTNI